MHHRRAAFTLVEMSLVVVIIGLIIGGALGGRALARAAEIRGVMTDANLYIAAIANFKQQYRALPGDMLNANTYWAAATSGNGNGQINATTPEERYAAWEHLSLAGFADKAFTGNQGGGGADDFVPDENIPSSRVKNSGFALYYADIAAGSRNYDTAPANMLTFGAAGAANSGPPINALFKPADAFMLDTKMDDGIPGTGNWVASGLGPANGGGKNYDFGDNEACFNGNNGGPGTYNNDNTNISCSFFIFMGL